MNHRAHEPLVLIVVHTLAVGLVMPLLARLRGTQYEWWLFVPLLLFVLLPFIALLLMRLAPPEWQWIESLPGRVLIIDAVCVCLAWLAALVSWLISTVRAA